MAAEAVGLIASIALPMIQRRALLLTLHNYLRARVMKYANTKPIPLLMKKELITKAPVGPFCWHARIKPVIPSAKPMLAKSNSDLSSPRNLLQLP